MALTAFKQEPDLYRMDIFPLWFHMAPTLKHFNVPLRQHELRRLDRQHHVHLGLGRR